jgi:hypothetical protein
MEAALTTLAQAAGVSTEVVFMRAADLVQHATDPQGMQFFNDYVGRVESGAAVNAILADLRSASPTLTLAAAIDLVGTEAGLAHTDVDVALVALLPADSGTSGHTPVADAIATRLASGSVVADMVSALQSGNISAAAAQATLAAIGGRQFLQIGSTTQYVPNASEATLVIDVVATLGTKSTLGTQAAAFIAAESAALGGTLISSEISGYDQGTIDITSAVSDVYVAYMGGTLPKGVTLGQAYESLVAAESDPGRKVALYNQVAVELGADVSDQSITAADAIKVIQAIGTRLGQPIENALVALAGPDGDRTGDAYDTHTAAINSLRAEYTSGPNGYSDLIANALGDLAHGSSVGDVETMVRNVAQLMGFSGERDIAHLLDAVSVDASGRLTESAYAGGPNDPIAHMLHSLTPAQSTALATAIQSAQAQMVSDIQSGAEATRIVNEWYAGYSNVFHTDAINAGVVVEGDMSTVIQAVHTLGTGLSEESGIVQLAQTAANRDEHSALTTGLEHDIAQRVTSGAAIDQIHQEIIANFNQYATWASTSHGYSSWDSYQQQVTANEMKVYADEVEIAAKYNLEQMIVAAAGDADKTATVVQDLTGGLGTNAAVLQNLILSGQADAVALVHDPAYEPAFAAMRQFAELGVFKTAYQATLPVVINADGSVGIYDGSHKAAGQSLVNPDSTTPAFQSDSTFLEEVAKNDGLRNDILAALGVDAATNLIYAQQDGSMVSWITGQVIQHAGSITDQQTSDFVTAAQTQAQSGIAGGLENLAVIHAVVGAIENFSGHSNREAIKDTFDAAAEIAARGLPLLALADGLATKMLNSYMDVFGDSLLTSLAGDDAATWAAGGAIKAADLGPVAMAIMGVSVLDAFVDSEYGSWMGSGVQEFVGGLAKMTTALNEIISDVVNGTVTLVADTALGVGYALGDLFSGQSDKALGEFSALPSDFINSISDIFTTLQSMNGGLSDANNPYNRPGGIFG